jgi:hypothetical protein
MVFMHLHCGLLLTETIIDTSCESVLPTKAKFSLLLRTLSVKLLPCVILAVRSHSNIICCGGPRE